MRCGRVIAYFYERIVPVAEQPESGWDPPRRPAHDLLPGCVPGSRSFEGLKRWWTWLPAPTTGVALPGLQAGSGRDVPAIIRYFGERDKIFYVHFRNVAGAVAPDIARSFPTRGDGT